MNNTQRNIVQKNRILSITAYLDVRVVVSYVNGKVVTQHQNTTTGKITEIR